MWKQVRYIVLTYGFICSLYFAYQHLFYFQPKALAAKHIFTFPAQVKFSASKIPFDENTIIDVVKLRPTDTTIFIKGVVLFFHGNRFNVEHYISYAPYFTKHGYEVWMPDYPGFGRSTGEIEMGVLNELSLQLYKMARTQYAANQIVVYGKSLGTGIASYLAAERDCRHLILETPYHSLSSMTQTYAWYLPIPLLIRYNLKTGEYFKEITAPISVLAAEKDKVIPIGNTLRLLQNMKGSDAIYLVEHAGHNTLPDYPVYHAAIDSILQH